MLSTSSATAAELPVGGSVQGTVAGVVGQVGQTANAVGSTVSQTTQQVPGAGNAAQALEQVGTPMVKYAETVQRVEQYQQQVQQQAATATAQEQAQEQAAAQQQSAAPQAAPAAPAERPQVRPQHAAGQSGNDSGDSDDSEVDGIGSGNDATVGVGNLSPSVQADACGNAVGVLGVALNATGACANKQTNESSGSFEDDDSDDRGASHRAQQRASRSDAAKSTDKDDSDDSKVGGILSGNDLSVGVGNLSPNIQLDACGNAVGVLGVALNTTGVCANRQENESSGSFEDDDSDDRGGSAVRQSGLLSKDEGDSDDSKVGGILSGNDLSVGVGNLSPSIQIIACGNSVAVLGAALNATGVCANRQENESSGSFEDDDSDDRGGNAALAGQSGLLNIDKGDSDDSKVGGILSGNDLSVGVGNLSPNIQLDLSCNAVGVLGVALNATGTCANRQENESSGSFEDDDSDDGGRRASQLAATRGNDEGDSDDSDVDGILSGNNGTVGVGNLSPSIQAIACGNAVGVLGVALNATGVCANKQTNESWGSFEDDDSDDGRRGASRLAATRGSDEGDSDDSDLDGILSGNNGTVGVGNLSPSIQAIACGNAVGVLGVALNTTGVCANRQENESWGSFEDDDSDDRGRATQAGGLSQLTGVLSRDEGDSDDSDIGGILSGNDLTAGVGNLSPSIQAIACGNAVAVLGLALNATGVCANRQENKSGGSFEDDDSDDGPVRSSGPGPGPSPTSPGPAPGPSPAPAPAASAGATGPVAAPMPAQERGPVREREGAPAPERAVNERAPERAPVAEREVTQRRVLGMSQLPVTGMNLPGLFLAALLLVALGKGLRTASGRWTP